MRIVTSVGVFDSVIPDDEKSFEANITLNSTSIFGSNRYYLDCKRKLGGKGKKANIPDAYLIDLGRNEPRLFVIENELAEHDLFKHIGVQLLEFSFTYKRNGRQLKTILFEEISKQPIIKDACEKYALEKGYRNLDYLLDYLVFETPFQALVIIDEATDELFSVVKHFSFPVEIIEFVTYINQDKLQAFSFTPFLVDVVERPEKPNVGSSEPDIGELDTIVVPAREDGFREVFIGENRWYAVRIHSSMIPQIKYIAAYQVAPISAITHLAQVHEIVAWEDSGKYCITFVSTAEEITHIGISSSKRGLAPQSSRYTSMTKLREAKTLEDIF